MTAHVARDLAAAHREADQRRVAVRAGGGHHVGQIVGERVVIIAAPRLTRPSEPTPVIGDRAEARVRQRHHLRVPAVRRQRPAMDQDHGPARAPVLDVNIGAVARFDIGHGDHPLRQCAAPTRRIGRPFRNLDHISAQPHG
ncbi:hypothetical protein WR25_24848 [Diploscapter pachys]|uniref:Uncharacterized protein n=1 Tax=Diploscapter pachys TaxID=2018661 RepID=A0A2A2K6X1_9BILA|nr:hypothetical protein WR25_24848 [Diploscapter pachys]